MSINNFGVSLKHYLEKHRINKAALARDLEISPQSLQSMFKTANPGVQTIERILSVLKISQEEFYSFNNEGVEESSEDYKVKVIYKTKEQIEFENERREWQRKENEYLRQINELQQARIKELEEQSRA